MILYLKDVRKENELISRNIKLIENHSNECMNMNYKNYPDIKEDVNENRI